MIGAALIGRRLRLSLGLLGTGLLVCSGCVSPAVVRDVQVTASVQRPVASPGSFRVVSHPAMPADAKPTQEAAALVRRGLAGRGYRESSGANGSDLVITVSCGASGPSIQRTTEREPIYRVVQAPSHYERVQAGVTSGGSPIFELRLVESPAIQKLAGYRDVPRETNVFKKYLRLSAQANGAGTEPAALHDAWTIESVCEEAGASISEIVPALTAACLVYVGKETAGAEVIHVSDADQDVASLRRGN